MSDLVLVRDQADVVFVELNRPEKRNALSIDLIESLQGALDTIERSSARVLVLGGTGASFCAGMDLRGVLDDAQAMGGMLHGLARAMRRIRRLSIPTIARIQGAAVGGGCGLAVVCDLALTHPDAKLGYPEVSLGVCPAVVAPWLVRKIGPGPARAMLLQGGTMSGQSALEHGLVDRVVDRTDLETTAECMANELAKGGVQAIATTKQWLNELDGSLEDVLLSRAADLSAQVIASEEAQSRLRALFGD
ncbi:MAG: enoyl-CoA hydratase/isomerase family protein [Phycisphaerales bacterium]|nr:enoyl-CoA hydratase/isomerase family protein [Phycisphaerales bacterium]